MIMFKRHPIDTLLRSVLPNASGIQERYLQVHNIGSRGAGYQEVMGFLEIAIGVVVLKELSGVDA